MPFDVEQFLDVFGAYNRAVWPGQLLLYGLALFLVARVWWRPRETGQGPILWGLAFLWSWMAVVYHLAFFAPINPAARWFAAVFLLEALLLLFWGARQRAAASSRPSGARAWIGGALVAYGLVLYPLVSVVVGHRLPRAPTFGVPCPTTITTLGLLVWITPPARWLLIVPLAWSFIGASAAFLFGMKEDIGLSVAGITALAWTIVDLRTSRRARQPRCSVVRGFPVSREVPHHAH